MKKIKNQYDASKSSKHRKSATIIQRSEDSELTKHERNQLNANTNEQHRNINLIGWMVRMYTRSISKFSPQSMTGVAEIDIAIENLFKWHSKKRNFDIAERHGRDRAMMIFNISKIVNGDAIFLKTDDNAKLQGIQTDRLIVPNGAESIEKGWTRKNGLKLDDQNKVIEYYIANRRRTSTESDQGFEKGRKIKAENVIFDGYFSSSFDQTRGISPLAPAINKMKDLNSGWGWLLKKVELQAMMGLIITETENAESKGAFETADDDTADYDSLDPNDDLTDAEKYEVKLKNGLYKLELNAGDEAKMLQDTSPNAEIMPWSELMIRIILACLDIPYSFWDSAKANYSAKRGDMAFFENAIGEKRKANIEVLEEYAEHLLFFGNPTGKLKKLLDNIKKLCKKHDIDYNLIEIEWIPGFNSWIDKYKESQGYEKEIAIGMNSTPRACKEKGLDAYELADEEAVYKKYRLDHGLPYIMGMPGQQVEESQIKKGDDEDE